MTTLNKVYNLYNIYINFSKNNNNKNFLMEALTVVKEQEKKTQKKF